MRVLMVMVMVRDMLMWMSLMEVMWVEQVLHRQEVYNLLEMDMVSVGVYVMQNDDVCLLTLVA
jgi:hypothetical protein